MKLIFILSINRKMNKKILVLWAYVGLLTLVWCGAPRIIDDADELTVEYAFFFESGEVHESGTTMLVVGQEEWLFQHFADQFIGASYDASFEGILTPELTYGSEYNPALQQRLAEIYFTAMGATPAVGSSVFFPNLGEWLILATDVEEEVNYYTIDFNPMETYLPLNYQVQITNVVKK